MYWYVIVSNSNDRSKTSLLWTISQNIVTSPIYVGGKIYGTKENPFVKNVFEGSPAGNYATNRRRLYYGDTANIAVYDVTYVSNTQYSGYYGYGCSIFGVDTELEIPPTLTSKNTRVSSIDSARISGKFRLHNIITSNCQYNSFSIPVNFSINNVNYKSFGVLSTSGVVGFTGSPVIGEYFDYNVPKMESDFLTGWYNYTGTNRVIQIQTEDDIINGTYTRVNIDTTENISGDFAGKIIDFGVVEQEIPKFLFDFISANADPIYPYTFTVKSQNGVNVLASLEEAPAMVDATPSVVGNVKTLTMTGVNGKTYTMTWESETPDDKQFLGLAYGANETRASIPIGRTTPVTWDGSLTIYEAYGTYRPPVTTFDINLYQSSAEVNRVDKTNYLTGVGTLSGALREECSIMTPSITFKQTTVPSFNYVYIAAFGRYYYVTDITSISKDIWRMSLSCDVLMTWKDDIRALTAIIARQENSFNPLLLDSELPAQANQNITVTEFPAGGFNTANEIECPFVLTVVGG